MNIAALVKQVIRWVYMLSPYFWVDRYYKHQEFAFAAESTDWQAIRDKRLFLSEFYIVGWLVLSMLLVMVFSISGFTSALSAISIAGFSLADVLVILFLLRILGVLNKELGVILFGICKITEGSMVSATGRVIVLALTNFLTVMFLYAAIYQLKGIFVELPEFFSGMSSLAGLIQSIHLQFTMNTAFDPANAFTWLVGTSQAIFCFVFGTIVISLFVSLLNVKPLKA